MTREGYVASVALLCVATLFSSWFAAADQPAQDEPMYRLDPTYHQLPQDLVDRLMKEVPMPPGGSRKYYCFGEGPIGPQRVSYCVCYTLDACRELKSKEDFCTAKMGLIRPDVGVCRSNIEMVTVVQR